MSHRENITRIKAVYNALEEMANEVVFVGPQRQFTFYNLQIVKCKCERLRYELLLRFSIQTFSNNKLMAIKR
jgi:hypothetical protein